MNGKWGIEWGARSSACVDYGAGSLSPCLGLSVPCCTVRVFPICVIFLGQNMFFVTQAELLVPLLPVQPQKPSRIKNLALGKSRHWFKWGKGFPEAQGRGPRVIHLSHDATSHMVRASRDRKDLDPTCLRWSYVIRDKTASRLSILLLEVYARSLVI